MKRHYHKVIVGVATPVIFGIGLWLYGCYEAIETTVFEKRKSEMAAYIQNRASTLINPEDFGDRNSVRKPQVFETFFEAIQSPEIFRIKVFNQEPRIIWSNIREIIGRDASTNQEALDALKDGKITLKFKSSKPEQVTERQYREFTETYIQIPDAKGRIVGVIEVYQTAHSAKETIKKEFFKLATLSVGIALFAYLTATLVLRFLIKPL